MKEIYIKDITGNLERVEISEEVAELLNTFRREEKAYYRKIRKRRQKAKGADISYQDWLGITNNFEDHLLDKVLIEYLLQQLTEKKEKERIKLYYLQGYTYAEIAQMENKSVTAIYLSITRAIEKIKRQL